MILPLQGIPVLARNMIQEIKLTSGETNKQVTFATKFSNTPAVIESPPPEPGECREELLLDLGHHKTDIEKFQPEGVVGKLILRVSRTVRSDIQQSIFYPGEERN